MTSELHPPKQQRSRETLRRLLGAVIEVIDAHGLGGATIPRIAEAARVAPASVYRRFPDKESLLRAAFLAALEESNDANAQSIPAQLQGKSLSWVAKALARSIIAQYRLNPRRMRALIRFVENDSDEAFRSQAMNLVAANISSIVQTIVAMFGEEIPDADPQRAVTFALLAVANVVETKMLDDFTLWHEMLPLDDDSFAAELARLFIGYLLVQYRDAE